jgi:hypothetical protein
VPRIALRLPRVSADEVDVPTLGDGSLADPQFAAWLGGMSKFVVRRTRKHGQWYSVAQDFLVAGVGTTKVAADENLVGLLNAYLWSWYANERPFAECWRPMEPLHGARLRAMVPTRLRRFVLSLVRRRVTLDLRTGARDSAHFA